MKPVDVRRFASPAAFRAWLDAEHAVTDAQWVAIAKKHATHDRLSHAEALDIALAYGWIDGFVSKLDDSHYALRFSRRRPKSNWSAVNIRRFGELLAAGRVMPAGRAAFEARDRAVSEERPATLDGIHARRFRAQPGAWRFFSAQPPGYRRQAAWYVMSARTEATRDNRLQRLIDASGRGERLAAVAGVATAAARAQMQSRLPGSQAMTRSPQAPRPREHVGAAGPRAKMTARVTARATQQQARSRTRPGSRPAR